MVYSPIIYGYPNSRIRGMKSHLLSPSDYAKMLAMSSVEEIGEFLLSTPYKDSIQRDIVESPDKLDDFLFRHYEGEVSRILSFCPKKDADLIKSFLVKWDVHNLRVCLLGTDIPFEKLIPLFVDVGSVKIDDLERIHSLGERQFSAYVSSLDIFSVLNPVLSKPRDKNSLLLFLSKSLFLIPLLHMKASDKWMVRIEKILKKRIDARNIVYALEERNLDKLFIPMGNLSIDRLSSFSSDKEKLKSFVLREFSIGDFSSPLDLDALLNASIARMVLSVFKSSLFSPASLISFLMLKEEELNNIRKIVASKRYGISKEKVSSILVFL